MGTPTRWLITVVLMLLGVCLMVNPKFVTAASCVLSNCAASDPKLDQVITAIHGISGGGSGSAPTTLKVISTNGSGTVFNTAGVFNSIVVNSAGSASTLSVTIDTQTFVLDTSTLRQINLNANVASSVTYTASGGSAANVTFAYTPN